MTEVTTLVSLGSGEYESTDGRVKIHHDWTFITECDAPHPVRLRRDQISRYSDWYQRELRNRDRSGGTGRYITYQCAGNEEHFYSQWVVEVDGGWTDDVYETFEGAVGAAEEQVGPIKISRPRKPKPAPAPTPAAAAERERTFDPVTGVAHWAACGHYAELDIDEHCYTCHQPV